MSKTLLLEAAIFRVSGFDTKTYGYCRNAIENKVPNTLLLKAASADIYAFITNLPHVVLS